MKLKINLTDNLFLKILSVLIAILFWLVVMNINDAEKTQSYPVGVELINTDVITSNGKVFRVVEGSDFVTVRVRARKSVLDELKATDFILTADMQKDLKYDRMVGITVECKNRNIDVDDDVTLSRSNVEVSIEDSSTEQFPVHVGDIGEPSTGLVVGSLVPEQTIIKITGPVSIVEKIKTVEAQVDVTGLSASSVKTCELRLYDSVGGIIDNTYLNYVGKSDGIDVTVTLLNTKTVPLKFSYTGTPAENYVVKELSFKPETIEIAGNAGVLSGISRWEIPAEAVDVEGIDEELQLVIDLTQYLPTGVILKEAEDASALVIVEVEYVEPEEEEEEKEEKDEQETSKPSTNETSKPSGNEQSKPGQNDTTVDKEDTSTENKPSTGTEGTGSGNGTSKDETSTESGNGNNEAGGGNNDKTENIS